MKNVEISGGEIIGQNNQFLNRLLNKPIEFSSPDHKRDFVQLDLLMGYFASHPGRFSDRFFKDLKSMETYNNGAMNKNLTGYTLELCSDQLFKKFSPFIHNLGYARFTSAQGLPTHMPTRFSELPRC